MKSKNINQNNNRGVLELLAIDLFKVGQNYEITLLFQNNAFITLFTEILEGIHPSEVDLLLQVKDKKIKCRGLTFNLVKETFPNLLP